MPRNIELKARVADLESARRVAAELATEPVRVLEQIDTYFHVPAGRLKLREFVDGTAELIYYERSNDPAARSSEYQRTSIERPPKLRELLALALGLRSVVRKRRELFMHHNVRIHLDVVEGLGSFLEFEAIVGPEHDEADCRRAVERLRTAFNIAATDLLETSYDDMLTGR